MNEFHQDQMTGRWQVKFMIKYRERDSQKSIYRKDDFIESFQAVGGSTKSFSELVRNISMIPSVNIRERGILAIFREGIEPLWESPKNEQGSIIRFVMMKREPTEAELDKTEERKLGPVVNDEESIFMLFLTMMVFDHFSEYGNANGIYFKTESNQTVLEIWGGSAEYARGISSKLMSVLEALPFENTYLIKGEERKVALHTHVTITQIKGGMTHGQSTYEELKERNILPESRSAIGSVLALKEIQ